MKAKRLSLFLSMLLIGLVAAAQTYVGTMEVDGYTRKNVEARLVRTAQGDIELRMYSVKFARLMPVKVDLEIPRLSLDGTRLSGSNIIPTSKGKPYEKYKVTRFNGTADTEKISFSCLLGDKPMKFTGGRKKKNTSKNQ
ncbi:MAG: hypothetical protein IJ745_07415 [Bacteroidales bacterium]|nr:hypothetical protein [Bacteroidales bacterium]